MRGNSRICVSWLWGKYKVNLLVGNFSIIMPISIIILDIIFYKQKMFHFLWTFRIFNFWRFLKFHVYYNENMNTVKIIPWVNKSCILKRKLKKFSFFIDLRKLPKKFEEINIFGFKLQPVFFGLPIECFLRPLNMS